MGHGPSRARHDSESDLKGKRKKECVRDMFHLTETEKV